MKPTVANSWASVWIEAVDFLSWQLTPASAIGAHFIDPVNLAQPASVLDTSAMADLLDKAAAKLRNRPSVEGGVASESAGIARPR